LKSCKLQVASCMLQSCMHFYTAEKHALGNKKELFRYFPPNLA
jgi:hypothetical protein